MGAERQIAGASQPYSLNPTGTLSRRHLAHFGSAVDTWNHVIEKESLNINKLEHVLIEKVEQLFRDML